MVLSNLPQPNLQRSLLMITFRSPRSFLQRQFYRPVHPRHPQLWMDLFEVGLSMEGRFQNNGTSVIIAIGYQVLSTDLSKQCRRMTWDLRGTRLALGGATRNQSVWLLGIEYLAITAPYTTSPCHSTQTTTQRVTFTSNLHQQWFSLRLRGRVKIAQKHAVQSKKNASKICSSFRVRKMLNRGLMPPAYNVRPL